MKAPMDVLWRGAETVRAVSAALAQRSDVALHLPANFHHAVAACFRARNTSDPIETIDVTGGAELLRELSAIQGLEHMAELQGPVARAHARVRVVSPGPTVAIHPAGASGQAS